MGRIRLDQPPNTSHVGVHPVVVIAGTPAVQGAREFVGGDYRSFCRTELPEQRELGRGEGQLLGRTVSYDRFALKSFDRRTWILPILEMLAEPFMVFAQLETRFGDDGKTITDLVKAGLNQEKREIYVARAPEEDRRSFENLRQLAKDLGVRPGDVMDAASALWGKYVLFPEAEAERRLLNSDIDLSNPNSVRTMRGHITRQVMRELADYFAAKRLEEGEATSG